MTYHEQALAIIVGIGGSYDEVATLNHLGAALCRAGELGESLDRYRRALGIARTIGALYECARGLHGLATVLSACGEFEVAGRHLAEAKRNLCRTRPA